MVEIENIRDLLYREHDLAMCNLSMLKPDNENYNCMLLQPSGPLFADETRIGHLNPLEAYARCKGFLQLAYSKNSKLAVTPEYCLPWRLIQEAIDGENYPRVGAIWALGCESITWDLLNVIRNALKDKCVFIYEDIDVSPDEQKYLNPIVFLFNATDKGGGFKRVAVVQFKTLPSRDEHFLENKCLLRGKKIYQFKNVDNLLSFAAIICSDAFAFTENSSVLRALTDRATLLHIQLNPAPRHKTYQTYRALAFGNDDLSNCDIICLNWARGMRQHNSEGNVTWIPISASTWYIPIKRCATQDENIGKNHLKGVYYSRLARRHALLLNYDEAIFQFEVTKPISDGSSVLTNTTGPTLTRRYIWDITSSSWHEDMQNADSGFGELIKDPDFSNAISAMINASAIDIERVIALCAADISFSDNWFRADELSSCRMADDEIVQRITFTHDPSDESVEARHGRVQQLVALAHIIESNKNWPPQIADIKAGSEIKWSLENRHFNIHFDGVEPILLSYLREHPRNETVAIKVEKMFEMLRRQNSKFQKRFAICYRRNGTLEFAPVPYLTRFDYAGGARTDFTSPLPLDAKIL